MKIIFVDNNSLGLKQFEMKCVNDPDVEIIGAFKNSMKALEFANENLIDVAILEIELPEMNGLELCDHLRELYPNIVVIVVSANIEYVQDAILKHEADYFILKPYTDERVIREIERAKLLSVRQRKCVKIRTFGNFEVTVDGKALKMKSLQAMEILALLVDHNGGEMNSNELFAVMYPEYNYDNFEAAKFRHAVLRLQKSLANAGIENIIKHNTHSLSINRNMVECDYFDFLDGKFEAIQDYTGLYMSQFRWSSARIVELDALLKKMLDSNEDDLNGI